MKLNIAYFGTPDFSAKLLNKLITNKNIPIEITAIVTQPDKPVGRKKIITPSPVKQIAQKHRLSTFDKPASDELYDFLDDNAIDLALVYAYGYIISEKFFAGAFPIYGYWNIHPSLLPKYRGGSPIAYPLILGDAKTGVSLIKMDSKMDHGPLIAQKDFLIIETDTRTDLENKLSELSFQLLKETFSKHFNTLLKTSKIPLREQSHENATFTRQLTRDDGYISLSVIKNALNREKYDNSYLPKIIEEYLDKYPKQKKGFFNKTSDFSLMTYNLWRGLYPWPGIWTKIKIHNEEKRLKITNMRCSNGKLEIINVQLEGKKEVKFSEFIQYYDF